MPCPTAAKNKWTACSKGLRSGRGPDVGTGSGRVAPSAAPAGGPTTRGRLRRSTHIGGIATDHGATARAARSTPTPSRSRRWRAALTWGATGEQQSNASHLGAARCSATARIAGGRRHRQRQRRQQDTTPAPSLRLRTARAPKPCTRRISHTPHRIASNAYSRAKPLDHRDPSLRQRTAQPARRELSTG